MTKGQSIAAGIRPFITSGPMNSKDAKELIDNIAKSIDNLISPVASRPTLELRVKQFLSSLDYENLTDYQAKLVLLLEREFTPRK